MFKTSNRTNKSTFGGFVKLRTFNNNGNLVILCIGSIKNDCRDNPWDFGADSSCPRKSQNAWFSFLWKKVRRNSIKTFYEHLITHDFFIFFTKRQNICVQKHLKVQIQMKMNYWRMIPSSALTARYETHPLSLNLSFFSKRKSMLAWALFIIFLWLKVRKLVYVLG